MIPPPVRKPPPPHKLGRVARSRFFLARFLDFLGKINYIQFLCIYLNELRMVLSELFLFKSEFMRI